MLPEGTIVADRIWKRFRADRRVLSLRDRAERVARREWRRRGWRWSLRDVSMRCEPGDALGLIGVNGSGKSTLLKILHEVMYPYAGHVEASGRVGALIEVRQGIHPQLTGRANVYLFGALLGMRRSEVAARFDEIVGFAELEHAIDRQVKFYSTGMQMRLGFAVAAFLDPDVMLVDEVLAVGDAAFQQRCIEKLRSVLAEGTTLVFVSHDLAAVEAVCRRGVLLDEGLVRVQGPIADVLEAYRKTVEASTRAEPDEGHPLRVRRVTARGSAGGPPHTHEDLELRLELASDAPRTAEVYVGLTEGTATPVFVVHHAATLDAGTTQVRCRIQHLPLPRGRYAVWVGASSDGEQLVPWSPLIDVDVAGPTLEATPTGIVRLSPVYVDASWETAPA